ncbi:MAG: hypothetical protein IKR98_00015 [Bacteroidaceae bacterium]|nr:hypothetical protein [Bacteroidaceae bacterium]
MEEDILGMAEDDVRTVEFIKAYLPQEVKPKFTDDDLFYFLDAIAEYYSESGVLEQEGDEEGYIEIDTEAVAKAIAEKAKQDKMGEFDIEDLIWIVQADLEFSETSE